MTTARPTWTTDLLPAAAEWPAQLRARASAAINADLDAAGWERVRIDVLRASLVEASRACTVPGVGPMIDSVVEWLEAGADLAAIPQGIAPHMAPAADAARTATHSAARRPDSVAECIGLALDQVDRARQDVGAAQQRIMTAQLDAIEASR